MPYPLNIIKKILTNSDHTGFFMSSWADKSKNDPAAKRAEPKSRGSVIMDIAEKIRPFVMNIYAGLRDEAGMLYQPAHIRGVALNMAQDLLKMHEENSNRA